MSKNISRVIYRKCKWSIPVNIGSTLVLFEISSIFIFSFTRVLCVFFCFILFCFWWGVMFCCFYFILFLVFLFGLIWNCWTNRTMFWLWSHFWSPANVSGTNFNMWTWRVSHTTKELNSCTVFQKIALDSTGLRALSYKTDMPTTSDTSLKSQVVTYGHSNWL